MSSHTGTSSQHPDSSPLQLFNMSGISVPLSRQNYETLIRIVEKNEKIRFSLLELVYVDEQEIIRINKEYLNRSYITDIISFSYDNNLSSTDNPLQDTNEIDKVSPSKSETSLEGTLYCCAQRIIEQSVELNTDQMEEFSRVFIHGLLHLAGYDDQSPEEKRQMTSLEDTCLSLFRKSAS